MVANDMESSPCGSPHDSATGGRHESEEEREELEWTMPAVALGDDDPSSALEPALVARVPR